MKILFLAAAFLLLSVCIKAQELFPHTEPASNSPKGVLGFRVTNEFYNEVSVWRSMQCYRFLWAFTPRLMLIPAITFSNHHGKKLPANFIANDGNIGLHTHGTQKGNKYPYDFDNIGLYLKYRFLSRDAENTHFRMAAFAEGSFGSEPHDEAEPSFMGDNSGAGGGLVATWLKKKLAASITSGIMFPYRYTQQDTANIRISYGKAFHYSLSAGYLLLPFRYKSYSQTNVNLYVELMGKSYDEAGIRLNGQDMLIDNAPTLEKGNYIEVRPSVQFIIKSNTRLDLSLARPLLNRSWVKVYPVYYLSLQHYFF